MKNLAIALLLIFVSLMASAATPESVQFQGLVRVNDGVPTRFDVQVPSGQQLVVTLGDGSKLELATPGSQLSPDAAMARLLSASGKTLHTATYPNKGLASASLDYLVCHGRVTYISPAPATAPACSQQ
jgi:hypothetical protein